MKKLRQQFIGTLAQLNFALLLSINIVIFYLTQLRSADGQHLLFPSMEFQAYDTRTQKILEKCHREGEKLVCLPIGPFFYEIDLQNMVQKNIETEKVRKIRRCTRQTFEVHLYSTTNAAIEWQVPQFDGSWVPAFHSDESGRLNSLVSSAYSSFLRQRPLQPNGQCCTSIRAISASQNKTYTVDFIKGKFIDETTRQEQPIRFISRLGVSSSSHGHECIVFTTPKSTNAEHMSVLQELLPQIQQEICSDSIDVSFEYSANGTRRIVVRFSQRALSPTVPILMAIRINTLIHEVGIERGTIISTKGEICEMALSNLRLLPLLSPVVPLRVARTRDQALLLLAHSAIWKADCTVYGGYIRDWVLRGESANDIDVMLTKSQGQYHYLQHYQ